MRKFCGGAFVTISLSRDRVGFPGHARELSITLGFSNIRLDVMDLTGLIELSWSEHGAPTIQLRGHLQDGLGIGIADVRNADRERHGRLSKLMTKEFPRDRMRLLEWQSGGRCPKRSRRISRNAFRRRSYYLFAGNAVLLRLCAPPCHPTTSYVHRRIND